MTDNAYSLIPSFTLHDHSFMSDEHIDEKFTEAIVHTSVQYSIKENGDILMDECYKNKRRSRNIIMTVEEYNQNYGAFSNKECCRIILNEHNTSEYLRIISTEKEWHTILENVPFAYYTQNVFAFFILVRKYFENWFYNEWIDVPFRSSIVMSDTKQTNEQNFSNELSKVPLSQQAIKTKSLNLSIKYINSEIKKLKGKYIKKDIASLCGHAYKNIIQQENDVKIISVAEYTHAIYPEIKHKFKKWDEKQFINYTKNLISA
ncbi:MAG: hypothetical protein M1480_13730 [Bacteroidetes bacterium]|nr:hypothetical protein [Bacteroidota bacterium]